MEALTLVVASAMVLVAATAGAALLRPRAAVDTAVAIGVLATGEIALLTGVAGAFGHLRPGVVLTAAGLWTVVALWAARSRRSQLPWVHLDLARVRNHPWVATLVVVGGVGLAWQVLVAVVLPVYAYDALTYHGTTLATWLQRGDIAPPELSACCAYYANTAELLSVWPMLLLGRDALVDVVQLPFVLLGAASVAGLARSLGLDRASAAAAAAIFVATPVVLAQASTNYVDVMVAAWSLAGLHALVRFAATRAIGFLVTGAVAAGLLLGTKGTGIVWGAVFVVTGVVVVVVCARRGWLTRAAAARSVAVAVLVPAALGSFWYVRNWVDTGNPLYPFNVEVAGVEVFDGPAGVGEFLTVPDVGADQPALEAIVRSWAADLDVWNQGPYDYQQRAGGLGPAWAWLGLPLLVPIGIVALRRRHPGAIAFAVVGAVFVVQPYRWWSRFTIQLAALGAVAIVAALAWLPDRRIRIGLRSASLALVTVGVALTTYAVNPASRAPSLSASDLVALVDEPTSARTIGQLFFPEYRFVDDVPVDATVLVDRPAEAVRFLYPLFGRTWSRTVIEAGPSARPDGVAWVVTGEGRPLDDQMRADARYVLASDVRGLHAWRPRP